MVKTKLSRANSKSNSLRATVPESVVESLKLAEGDEVDWVLSLDGKALVATVKKVK